ncbi:hypothetical protein CKO25_10965 [Thiocapsa imhoffii]|uniref:Tetratricopeptide repeat protein n=1 Tax=Thiocapsa imhoffii TaxID=382777 RepID=A0A9X0WIF1_9GAMM|nr:tetratricopeptide repeat protein [Thiocapsa imhoffii]MBK1645158.1 hypothetical protein [Thiocapsa imhoffii]
MHPRRFSRFRTTASVPAGLLVLALVGGMAPAQSEPVSERAPPSETPPVEMVGLTADQVFMILAAELAARRGETEVAFAYYMDAAELTQDARIAELAVRSAISGDDSAAIDSGVQLWLELDPSSLSAHQVGAFSRIKASDHEGALIHLMRLVDLTPDDPDAAFAHAAAIITRAPTAETRLGLMQALADQYRESAHAQHSLAMVAASARQIEIADAAARRALELSPQWNKPRLFLVKLLISEDRREEARLLLEEYLGENPDDQSLRLLYGQFLVEEEEFSSARDVFERLLRNRPKEPDVLFAVGILSLQLDDLEGARLYFTRLYDTGERRDEAAYYLGQTEERAEQTDLALQWYERVEGVNAIDSAIRIAFLKASSGDIAGSREILQGLRNQGPENAILLYLIEAEVLESVGSDEDAMAVYDRALATYPDDETLLYARALAAVKRDRIEQAERDLRRIIEIDPDHADALNALGYTLADRTDRYEEALVLIERAYTLKPDEPAILDSMGWVYFRLGQYELALDYLERALEAMSDGEIAAHLGEVLWAMDRHPEALAVWNAALQEHPEHPYLNEVIQRYRAQSAPGSETRVQEAEGRP